MTHAKIGVLLGRWRRWMDECTIAVPPPILTTHFYLFLRYVLILSHLSSVSLAGESINPGNVRARFSKSPLTKYTTAHNIESRTATGTSVTIPKSKYASLAGVSLVFNRFPPWGSACRKPTSNNCLNVHLIPVSSNGKSSLETVKDSLWTSLSPSTHCSLKYTVTREFNKI